MCVVMRFYVLLMEEVVDEVGFPYAAWGNHHHVAAVDNLLPQEVCLLTTVAEILVGDIVSDNERIVDG